MNKQNKLTMALFIAILCTAGFVMSCSDSATSTDSIDLDALIEEVRAATAAYHNVESAKAAGWVAVMSPCVEHPSEGGMGYHYGRPGFIDGRINHLEPQILLYEPLQGGELAFVGVEYIIPFDIHPAEADAPELFGHEYHANQGLGIWALHVWTEKENPNGMFFDWNPNVSCQYEPDVMIAEVKAVTQDYHDFDAAVAAGWDAALSPCVEHPELGGMGYHYGRMEYMDGRAVHTDPQVLLYEPLEDGSMEFIGVEYIIPFSIHPADAEPPVLFGEEYHQNPQQEIWALHVWTEKENPSGLFSDWNPNVSCQHAND